MARTQSAGSDRRCGDSGRPAGCHVSRPSGRSRLDVDGLTISFYMLAPSGIGVQLFVLTMGLDGTVTILFFVRTTAARQPLILS